MSGLWKPFVTALVGFAVLDGIWLGVVMKNFYRTALGPMARTGPDGALTPIWAVALPVYVLLALGQVVFVLPRITGESFGTAITCGAVFGFITYGVYDLTNWSTLRSYTGTLALVDMAWGTFACAAVAGLLRKLAG
ncbi:MAG: DUF2177 family protein [Acidobacteriota bacterium]